MASQSSLLSPCNGKLNLEEAYKWDLPEIYGWMKRVADNPEHYGAESNTELESKKKMLAEIRQEIILLSIPVDHIEFSGSEYGSEHAKPDHHIYREKNVDNIPGPGPSDPPPFLVRQFIHKLPNRTAFWSPYDLLGLFMSLICPAPANATRENFYIPLTAVYGKWCYKIGPPNHNGNKIRFPSMLQCTWNDQSGFFMGASSGGLPIKTLMESWYRLVYYNRFLLCAEHVPHGYEFQYSPGKRNSETENAWPYGNCGETYPLLMILSGNSESGVEGFAMKSSFVKESQMEGYKRQKIQLKNPCLNCIDIIREMNGKPGNFRADAQNSKPAQE